MKKFISICLVCACVLLTTAAQGNIIISFDENGNGDIDGTSLLSAVGSPPSPIPGDPTLYYGLPAEVVEGDVVIYENAAQTIISDLLRFDIAAPPCVFIYSETEAGKTNPELADTGIPTAEWINVVRVLEEGTENGWNGIHYTPTSNQPGYIDGENVTYIFTSDVPEPATICILGLGALSLIRRKK